MKNVEKCYAKAYINLKKNVTCKRVVIWNVIETVANISYILKEKSPIPTTNGPINGPKIQ